MVVSLGARSIPWHQFLLHNKFITIWARNVLCCEVFKILEEDFTELLRSYLGMPLFSHTLEKLRAAINFAAKSHKYQMDTPLLVSFGVFASALVTLHDVELMSQAEKEELARRISLGKTLFMDIVQKGISSLRERCEIESVGIDEQIEEALAFMCNDDNFEVIIREWAAAAGTWATRNASYPFGELTNHEDRQTAINYFGTLVDGEYCKSFRNVALLGKLHLQLVDIKASTSLHSKNVELIKEFLQ